ncbi:MAG: hypothetical protein LBP80_00115 [Treponema sp.]|jgi:hypothetical protein|nr:hypothetical protein [Treponema sp.]
MYKSELMNKILEKFYGFSIAIALREIHRPQDIPFLAPDCGWNHGEPKPDVKKTTDNEHGHNA